LYGFPVLCAENANNKTNMSTASFYQGPLPTTLNRVYKSAAAATTREKKFINSSQNQELTVHQVDLQVHLCRYIVVEPLVWFIRGRRTEYLDVFFF
jgi:hypothetical protein